MSSKGETGLSKGGVSVWRHLMMVVRGREGLYIRAYRGYTRVFGQGGFSVVLSISLVFLNFASISCFAIDCRHKFVRVSLAVLIERA